MRALLVLMFWPIETRARRLDPLARHDFMAALMATVAEDGISVLYSSHVVSELERVSDYLVVLAAGQVHLAAGVEEVLATHWLYTGPASQADQIAAELPVIHDRRTEAQARPSTIMLRGAGSCSLMLLSLIRAGAAS